MPSKAKITILESFFFTDCLLYLNSDVLFSGLIKEMSFVGHLNSQSIRGKGISKRLYDCDITLALLLKWVPVRDAILESIAELQLPPLPQCLLSKYILFST